MFIRNRRSKQLASFGCSLLDAWARITQNRLKSASCFAATWWCK